MKKLIFISIFSVFLTGCGVGVYSIQSGYSDVASIVFTDDTKGEIVVNVDNKTYHVNAVKHKAYKSGRDIKHTAENTIKLTPGQHNVSVFINGSEVYNRKVFLSTGETKVIEL